MSPDNKSPQKRVRDRMQTMGKFISRGLPPGWGFGLLVFEFRDTPGANLQYVSNAERDDMIRVLRGYADHLERRAKGGTPEMLL